LARFQGLPVNLELAKGYVEAGFGSGFGGEVSDAEIYELGHKRKPAKVGLFNQEETEDADEATAPTTPKPDDEPGPSSDPPDGVAA
jgi:hypothetical protein